MPCDDCPEKRYLPGAIYITYGGGPPSAPFAAVAQAIPPADDKIITLYGTPTVNQDGSISYNKEGPQPPVPAGYERVPGDDWTLRPIWKSCMYRLLRVHALEDGSLNIAGLCSHPLSGVKAQELLDPKRCETCPVRAPIPRSTSAKSKPRESHPPQ